MTQPNIGKMSILNNVDGKFLTQDSDWDHTVPVSQD